MPSPVPLAPLVITIQLTGLEAAQEQVLGDAVTPTLPIDAEAAREALEDVRPKVQFVEGEADISRIRL